MAEAVLGGMKRASGARNNVITILLGILIWAHWPPSSGWVVGTLFGISIFISGITRLMVSLAIRRVATQAA